MKKRENVAVKRERKIRNEREKSINLIQRKISWYQCTLDAAVVSGSIASKSITLKSKSNFFFGCFRTLSAMVHHVLRPIFRRLARQRKGEVGYSSDSQASRSASATHHQHVLYSAWQTDCFRSRQKTTMLAAEVVVVARQPPFVVEATISCAFREEVARHATWVA